MSHCKNHLHVPTLNQEFQLTIISVEAVISRHLAWSSRQHLGLKIATASGLSKHAKRTRTCSTDIMVS